MRQAKAQRAATSPSRKRVVFVSPDGKEFWGGRGAPPEWFSLHLARRGSTASDLLAPGAVLPLRFKLAQPTGRTTTAVAPVTSPNRKRSTT